MGMEPEAIQAIKRRNVRCMSALRWSSLIGMAAVVIFAACRDGSYLVLSGLVPVAVLALLGQGRPGRTPDFWYGKASIAAFGIIMAIHGKSWILLILVAVILVEGFRSWRTLDFRRSEGEERT